MTPEGLIKNQICSYLARKRVFFWTNDSVGIFDPKRKVFRRSVSPYRIKGTADILGIYQGRFLAIEVKSKTGRLTPEQKTFLERVNAEGGIGLMARSYLEVAEKLEAATKAFSQTDPGFFLGLGE